MKLIIIYIFIFLASSTYRCSDGGQIDCATASQEMIGVWEGELVYERPNSARNKRNKQTWNNRWNYDKSVLDCKIREGIQSNLKKHL